MFALQWFLTSYLKHITVNKTTWRTTTTSESLFHFLLHNNYFTDICSTLLDELEKTDSNILNFQTIKLWKYFLVIALNMMWIKIMIFSYYHCVKSVRIQSFSVPYSVQMRETANQKNSEYGHLSRSVIYLYYFYFKSMQWKVGKHNQSKSTPWDISVHKSGKASGSRVMVS